MNDVQCARFSAFIQDCPGPKSFSNSAALFSFPEQHYDLVRPGISLYGVSPFTHISAEDCGLRPVMQLQTRLIAVRHMPRGASIGYGARYICPENMPNKARRGARGRRENKKRVYR